MSAEGALFVEERKIKILEFIEEHRKATVVELCAQFKVSSATIRNDLRDLETAGLLIRTHGGAMVKTKTGLEPDMSLRRVQNLEEKRRIAEAALHLVEDGDTIILDTGTTTYELARLLGQKRDLTVVTNDLPIAMLLEDFDAVRVVLIGGMIRRKFHCTVASHFSGMNALSDLTVDKAFMAANGFSLEKGASTPDMAHSETKRLMISIAARVVLLFDSSKMGHNSFAIFAPLDKIDAIVTDSLRDEERHFLEENGVEAMTAGHGGILLDGHPAPGASVSDAPGPARA
jgi:DeoR family transcriptional regulator, fructose operon transcriptional repressor